MNIYAARKLQQALYKRAKVDHKYMMCTIIKGELYYHVVSRLCNVAYMPIITDFLEAIYDTVKIDDMETTIFSHSGTIRNWPPGMYLAEIIKID